MDAEYKKAPSVPPIRNITAASPNSLALSYISPLLMESRERNKIGILPGPSKGLRQHRPGNSASSSEAFLDSKKLCGPSEAPDHTNGPRKTVFGFKEAINEVQIEAVQLWFLKCFLKVLQGA